MMLCKQNGKGKTDIADTGNGDFIGSVHGDFCSALLDIQIGGLKVQSFCKGFQLFDGRDELLRFETGEQAAVDPGDFRELGLGNLLFLPAGDYGFGEQRKRQFFHIKNDSFVSDYQDDKSIIAEKQKKSRKCSQKQIMLF